MSDHMNLIKIPTNIGKIKKWLPRGRLVFLKNKEPTTSVIQLTSDLKQHYLNLNSILPTQ